jgi:hypothetical protein
MEYFQIYKISFYVLLKIMHIIAKFTGIGDFRTQNGTSFFPKILGK